jgi:hypothetical protein
MQEIHYLTAVTVGLCFVYFFLEHVFNLFFEKHLAHLSRRTFNSVALIIIASFMGYFISWSIPDPVLGNRFLHIFGGGFLALMVCFLVVKDSRIHITRFQFFVFSFLIVTTLGAANEILEFILQNLGWLTAATTVNDTWLDLISNAAGIIIGTVAFTPFIHYPRT